MDGRRVDYAAHLVCWAIPIRYMYCCWELDIRGRRLYNTAGNKPSAGVGRETLKSQDVDGVIGFKLLHVLDWMNA